MSNLLGLRLSLDGWGKLELFDVESWKQLLDDEDARVYAEIQADIQRMKAEQEAQRAEKAEQELAKLRAQLARLQANSDSEA